MLHEHQTVFTRTRTSLHTSRTYPTVRGVGLFILYIYYSLSVWDISERICSRQHARTLDLCVFCKGYKFLFLMIWQGRPWVCRRLARSDSQSVEIELKWKGVCNIKPSPIDVTGSTLPVIRLTLIRSEHKVLNTSGLQMKYICFNAFQLSS